MQAQIGARYRHYKNEKEYTVLALARHSETLEELVVYRAEYATPDFPTGQVWVRPRTMFEEMVERDGVLVPRFSKIEP